jgi:sn-glycerol 3-phosphate transport system permease protein
MKTNKREIKWHIVLWIVVVLEIFPLLFMISTSFKSMDQVFSSTLNIMPKNSTFKNYMYILNNLPIFSYIKNTFIIALVVTLSKLFT